MTTSLVTGGAGFIGSHVADELFAMGHRVVVLDDLSGGHRPNVDHQARFVEGSVLDHKLIDALFAEEGFDYVFHLAAYAAEGLSHFIRRFNYENNLVGSVNLIDAAVNSGCCKCFVFTSSIAVYGINQVPMTEASVPMPIDPYGIAKYAVEQDLALAREMFGLDYIVFRPHNVYGERQNLGDRYRNVIGIFMNQAMRGEPFTIFGDGNQLRAFSHISDVAPVIAHSIEEVEAHGEVFNIGGDAYYTVNEVAREVAEAFGTPLRCTHLPKRHEAEEAYSSHDKVRAFFPGALGSVSLHEGIARMADWAKSADPQERSVFDDIEIERNLPPSWAAARVGRSN